MFPFSAAAQQGKDFLPQKETLKTQISFEEKLLATIPNDYKEAPASFWGRGYTTFGIAFSPDGMNVAYKASKGEETFVVIGDQKGSDFTWVSSPTFSKDGTKVIYRADDFFFIHHQLLGDKTMKIKSKEDVARCDFNESKDKIACAVIRHYRK